MDRYFPGCGDLVLDPFCSCGTDISAAEKLHRRWMGIDVTYLAINLVKRRLTDEFPNIKFRVEGEPHDIGGAKNLALRDRYQFQCWALSLISAIPLGLRLILDKSKREQMRV